ncbi:hypothetical protein TIFTF001_001973 [Ficus carica]|uniref:Uncharacterized protein n=1 Tax=Ficus carica TaxID=3494 RepID=A0AA87ZR87_FICCA|nr:hypothetical protein TIFTF001_001973 [Ficus carica]
MKSKSRNPKGDSNPLWNWNETRLNKKRNTEKRFPIAEFLDRAKQRAEDSVLGPGAGAGIGCGVGLGLGLVGGFGFGGSQWNHVKLVLGIGFGCGVGLGVGYGQGFGYGYSLESLESDLSNNDSDSHDKRGLIGI